MFLNHKTLADETHIAIFFMTAGKVQVVLNCDVLLMNSNLLAVENSYANWNIYYISKKWSKSVISLPIIII